MEQSLAAEVVNYPQLMVYYLLVTIYMKTCSAGLIKADEPVLATGTMYLVYDNCC